MCHRGTCIRYGHSGPGARLVGRMPLRPGVSPPRVSPPRGFAPGYGPPGLQPGRVRAFGSGARLGGVCDTPLPWYVHSGPFGYPAKFAGVRRRPGFRRPGFRPGLWSTGPTARPGTGERPVGAPDHSQGRNPWCVDDRGDPPRRGGYPTSFAGVRRRPEASETLKQLVWAFPRPRKP